MLFLSFISDFHLLSSQLSRINLDQIHFFQLIPVKIAATKSSHDDVLTVNK